MSSARHWVALLVTILPGATGAAQDSTAKALLDYRPSIRTAARKTAAILDRQPAPPFDPVAAVRSAPIRELMTCLEPFIFTRAPADTAFVEIECCGGSTEEWDGEVVVPWDKHRGWLLERTSSGWIMLTPHGRRRVISRKCRHENHEPAVA